MKGKERQSASAFLPCVSRVWFPIFCFCLPKKYRIFISSNCHVPGSVPDTLLVLSSSPSTTQEAWSYWLWVFFVLIRTWISDDWCFGCVVSGSESCCSCMWDVCVQCVHLCWHTSRLEVCLCLLSFSTWGFWDKVSLNLNSVTAQAG